MFNRARIKLTFWYLLIIMLISISFSAAIYNFLTSEFNRVIRMEKLRQQGLWTPQRNAVRFFIDNNEVVPQPGNLIPPPNTEVIEEAKDRLLYTLIVINLAILGISGALGYFLASRTLKPIQDMMDEQNRFITDSSHELRTPLTSLKSEIEVNLRDKKLTLAQSRKILESNLEEVNNLQYLSDNLIKLAQNLNVSNTRNFNKVSIPDITRNAIKKVEKLAKKKNIGIENNIGDLTIYGEKQSLCELLVILLDNAIKYSPESTSIAISSRLKDSSAIIEVADQGAGIDKKDLPFLFDRFYRADRSRTKSDINGYGLGLSIAKQIVDKHNGSIEVKSEIEKGTTFIIKLPLKN